FRALLRDYAEEILAHVARRVRFETSLGKRLCLVQPRRVHHQRRLNLEALCRIALAPDLGVLARERWLALEGVDAGQGEMGLRLQRLDVDRGAECRDGILRPSRGEERLGQRLPGV